MKLDQRNVLITITTLSLLIVLSFVLGQIKLFQLPAGGNVTLFSLLPIALAGYFFGARRGVLAGIIVGILNFIFGGFVIHPFQLVLDYPLAYGSIGLSGLFKNKPYGLLKGFIFGLTIKYIFNVISGIFFFDSSAPENFNPFIWSLWYNLVYNLIEGLMTTVLILVARKRFDEIKNKLL